MLGEHDRKCHQCGRYLGKDPLGVYFLDLFLEAVPIFSFALLFIFLILWTIMALSMIAGGAGAGLGTISLPL